MISNLINISIVLILIAISIVLLGNCSHREQVTENCCQAEFNFKQQKISSDKLFEKKP